MYLKKKKTIMLLVFGIGVLVVVICFCFSKNNSHECKKGDSVIDELHIEEPVEASTALDSYEIEETIYEEECTTELAEMGNSDSIPLPSEQINDTETEYDQNEDESIMTTSQEETVNQQEGFGYEQGGQEQAVIIDVTEHQHSFVSQISYVFHPEIGHYESICVEEGYEEQIYENYSMCCRYCGEIMDDWSVDDLMSHVAMHGSYGSAQVVVDTIWHEPIYEEVWIVDEKEYYEEVITEKCTECGYEK